MPKSNILMKNTTFKIGLDTGLPN